MVSSAVSIAPSAVEAIGRGGQVAGHRGHRGGGDGQRVAVVGAHLEDLRAGAGADDGRAVELGLRGDARDFRRQRLVLGVQVGAVAGAVRAVLRLHRQFTHALQRVGDRGQRAFGRLRQRDAVVGVADRDVDAADLRVLAVAMARPAASSRGGIDAQARGQALHRGRQRRLRHVQVALGVQRHDVGVDRHRHEKDSYKWTRTPGLAAGDKPRRRQTFCPDSRCRSTRLASPRPAPPAPANRLFRGSDATRPSAG